MPNDVPPWAAVYQQPGRWLAAGMFRGTGAGLEGIAAVGLRPSGGANRGNHRQSDALRSTPESATRAGYHGTKRKRGSKAHMAVDRLGHSLAMHIAPADVGDRPAAGCLAADIQDATGDSARLAYVDQFYTGEAAVEAAAAEGLALLVVKLPQAEREFVLLH